jgi:hypothetical protein
MLERILARWRPAPIDQIEARMTAPAQSIGRAIVKSSSNETVRWGQRVGVADLRRRKAL